MQDQKSLSSLPVRLDHRFWKILRLVSSSFFLPPFILATVGYFLKKAGWQPLIPNYEEGVVRFVQYFLFALGAGIFLFCDGFASFLARRIMRQENVKAIEGKKLFSLYLVYTIFVMEMMNLISLSGFLGFLICSNLTWLIVFVLLQLSIQWRFWPTQLRLTRLFSQMEK